MSVNSDWVREQTNAAMALKAIAKQSPRLAVFLACKVAREALPHVPRDEQRPLRAIEAAERWVFGEATVEECKSAADGARLATAVADTAAAAYAAEGADEVAAAAAYAAEGADEVAAAAAYAAEGAAYAAAYAAAAEDAAAWRRVRDTELHRLCGVIGEELQSDRCAMLL